MNLLDTFLFVFESNTDKVQKGLDSGDAAAKKLGTSLDATDKVAEKLGANFLNIVKNGTAALASVLALGALKTLVNDTVAHTTALAMQARAIDMNVETMSAYQQAIVSIGYDGNAAVQSLAGLRDKFVEMSRFGTMVGPDAFMFRQLGLSAKEMHDSIKDPTIALGALADKFQTLDHTQQLYIGKKLGLDQGTIALLAQGRQAFDDMIARQKELGAVTQEQADAAMKYRVAQAQLGLTFETVKREIVTSMLPALTWIIEGVDNIVRWMREHKGFTIGFFSAMGTIITVALLPALVSATVATWAFLAPLLVAAAPFIALAAAVALVVDDIDAFRNGGNSMIGEVLNRWPAMGTLAVAIFKAMGDSLKFLNVALLSTGQYFAAIMQFIVDAITKGPSKALDILNGKTAKIGHNLSASFKDVLADAKDEAKAIKDLADQIRGTPEGKKEIEDAPKYGPLTANGKQIAAKLVATGQWTPEQAAGIAGSFMQESGGRANAVNPVSGAYGLGQWLGSRVDDFKAFAGKPLKGSSLDDQIAFFNYETSHKEKRAGDMLRNSSSASEAANIAGKYYERAGASEMNMAARERYAQMIMAGQSQLASTNTPLATSGGVTNTSSSSNRSVTIGEVHVHTQATDAAGISKSLHDELKRQINSALDYHDDGVTT